jgi:uncharacterized protein with NRDE domain
MCLLALAIGQSRRFPLVLAANRDERFDRPTAALDWWTPAPGDAAVLGGRDLEGGGTWFGLTQAGRLALVTNVRRPGAMAPGAPSRGAIVPAWLRHRGESDRFWRATAQSGHNPFNLVAADLARGEAFWASNDAAAPRRLEAGLYGVSNAALDTPWPKVTALKQRVAQAVALSDSAEMLAGQLFAALADRSRPDDSALPATGVTLELERELSPAFILSPDRRYGTRCSTVLICEEVGGQRSTRVIECSFSADSSTPTQRHVELRDWPPRHEPRH